MNIAKCAQATTIMKNVRNGNYVRGMKFANFGSVIEDSLIAQQKEADRRLREIQSLRAKQKVSKFA